MAVKFYICENCGNIITKLRDAKVPVTCCGQKMTELAAGAVDAAQEKHVPVVTVDANKVKVEVGSVEHPMIEAHYIQFVAIETTNGVQIKYLKPEEKPCAEFVLADGEELVSAYEYCNLHGLWMA